MTSSFWQVVPHLSVSVGLNPGKEKPEETNLGNLPLPWAQKPIGWMTSPTAYCLWAVSWGLVAGSGHISFLSPALMGAGLEYQALPKHLLTSNAHGRQPGILAPGIHTQRCPLLHRIRANHMTHRICRQDGEAFPSEVIRGIAASM